jgi:hypothetical protein
MPNPIDIFANINGLIPYEKYNYVFNSVGSNWPTVISPISGSFTASSTTMSIDATAYFCASAESCQDCEGLLDYDECLCNLGDAYFTKVQASFYLENDPGNVFKSDTIKLICDGCLPKAELVSVSGNMLHKDNKSPIQLIFSNLRKHKTYRYDIETLNSSWPFFLSSTSGLITAVNGVQDVVDIFGVYCATTGNCPPCEPGVLPYIIPTGCGCSKNRYVLPETSFRLLLRDPDCNTIIYYSNVLNISCSDCNRSYVSVSVDANELRNCQG